MRDRRAVWCFRMRGDGTIAVELVRSATDEVGSLVTELEEILSAEYPPEQRHGLRIEALFQPHIRFFVARLDGVAVGCGGVALFDGFAEVKRMYVREPARGRGVADAVLAALEAEAKAAGLDLLRLETGDRQYASMPAANIATSVFLRAAMASPSSRSCSSVISRRASTNISPSSSRTWCSTSSFSTFSFASNSCDFVDADFSSGRTISTT